jgi:hypothetical protein
MTLRFVGIQPATARNLQLDSFPLQAACYRLCDIREVVAE